jgi:hypothetical protein
MCSTVSKTLFDIPFSCNHYKDVARQFYLVSGIPFMQMQLTCAASLKLSPYDVRMRGGVHFLQQTHIRALYVCDKEVASNEIFFRADCVDWRALLALWQKQ